MKDFSHNLYDAAGCRELDRIAIEDFGIPGFDLMHKAGLCAFGDLCARWPSARSIAIICGSGNNGGDGYVVAEAALKAGMKVQLAALAAPRSADALRAVQGAQEAGLSVMDLDQLDLGQADVVVDAILGTGISRAPEGDAARGIRAIIDAAKPVLAMDVPSGLNSDNGYAAGDVVAANLTSTFIGMKVGLVTGMGPDCAGQISYHDLDVPDTVMQAVAPVASCVNGLEVKTWLPRRRPCAHKGDAGHLLLIGGNHGMPGALRIAAEAALRSGAGLVSALTRESHAGLININQPEIMCHGVESAGDRILASLLERADAIVIGPGLGQNEWARQMFHCVIDARKPTVVDADGLNLLAASESSKDDWILTPHPGEAAHLLGITTRDIAADRMASANRIVERFGGVCLIKGCGTVITDGETFRINTGGNPGMASGGMGDCLSGVIGALLAQGVSLFRAAQSAVYVHAEAADEQAKQNGTIGMLATDLLPGIRKRLNRL